MTVNDELVRVLMELAVANLKVIFQVYLEELKKIPENLKIIIILTI
jgi:hypothetical protein